MRENSLDLSGQDEGDEDVPKPTLPPWRTWVVRQEDTYTEIQEITVAAHECAVASDGVLSFITYSIVGDLVYQHMTRGFKVYRDFEEVMRVPATGRAN